MQPKLVTTGRNHVVYAIDLSDELEVVRCPALEFLDDLRRSTSNSHKSQIALLRMHAEAGPIHNTRRSRHLRGSDGIFEFKSRQGDRIAYFYPSGERRLTVLTHGFHKGANVNSEIRRAQSYRSLYHERRVP